MHGKRKKGLSKMSAHTGPNMTPMVDVVMTILIFFMLGSSLVSSDLYLTNMTPAIKTGGLSKAKGAAPMPPLHLNIRLDRRGGHTMATIASFQTEDLKGRLARWLKRKKKALGHKVGVVINPSPNVPYQDAITVYNDLVGARFTHVTFQGR